MSDRPRTFDHIAFGGDHSPEQWPLEAVAEDVRLMQAAGVNLVTLGVFSWASLQPTPDHFDWGWLDDAVEAYTSHGINIDMATPTASPPPWLGTADPEVRSVRPNGVRLSHGSRNHFCPSSTTYRQAARDIARRLGERYGSHPGVVMWHVGNEYSQYCFCDSCEQGFRDWLQQRYGTLEALNSAWGTAFWSQRYSQFSEIQLPKVTSYHVNPAQILDHRRWASDLLRDCFRDQAAVLRPLVGQSPITTNFMGFFEGVDYRSWADDIDIVADDHYANPDDPHAPARAALTHDLMRGIKGGQPWLMMEQAMGAVNWRDHNVPKTAVQRRHDVLRAVAHGADGVLSFQWRQSRRGSERFHSAMLPNSGAETRYHRSVREIGAELARLDAVLGTHVTARVAILDDWQARWAMTEKSVPSTRREPLGILEAWHRPLWRRGIEVDVVTPRDDLSDYDLLLAPALHVLEADGLTALRAHLEAGKALVMGPFSAAVDGHATLHPGPFPCGLTDLLQAEGEQWWPLGDSGMPVNSQRYGSGTATLWAEDLCARGAEVLVTATHPELWAAVVRSTSHRFSYIGCDLPEAMLDALLADELERAGITSQACIDHLDGLEVATRGEVTFVLNPSDQTLTVTPRGPVVDLLSDQRHDGPIALTPGDALALHVL